MAFNARLDGGPMRLAVPGRCQYLVDSASRDMSGPRLTIGQRDCVTIEVFARYFESFPAMSR